MTFNLQHNSDVTEAMKDAKLLTINNLYNLEIAQMMFKYENKQLLDNSGTKYLQRSGTAIQATPSEKNSLNTWHIFQIPC